jgi:hypothetical protein
LGVRSFSIRNKTKKPNCLGIKQSSKLDME